MIINVDRHSTTSEDPRVQLLEQYIRDGWRIEEPVLAHAMVRSPQGWGRMLEFVLRNHEAWHVLGVAESPAITPVLQQYQLSVIDM